MVVFKYSILSSLFMLLGCSKRMDQSSIMKTPYLGNELRIDGYYYSTMTSQNDIGLAIFYRDGSAFHTWITPKGSDIVSYLEREILLDDAYFSRIKNIPAHIGAFKVTYPNIEFEVFDYGGDGITTFSFFGQVRNDTTFSIDRIVNNGGNSTSNVEAIYRFRQFSPKPDSTSAYVK